MFEASLVYKVSSRTARATQRNPVSKKKKKQTNKKPKKQKKRWAGPSSASLLPLLHERLKRSPMVVVVKGRRNISLCSERYVNTCRWCSGLPVGGYCIVQREGKK